MRVIISASKSPLQLRSATASLARCRSSYSSYSSSSSSSVAITDTFDLAAPPLRVGVVGLGAIGTILFAKLGEVALAKKPSLAVDALVKPRHLAALFAAGSGPNGSEHPIIAIHEHSDEVHSAMTTRIAFRQVSERMAEATTSSSVRIRALASAAGDTADAGEENEADPSEGLDVVLVAVKAYDSAATVRGLQQHHAQLIKDDALVVLLQNGIGEPPTADGATQLHYQQQQSCRWRYAHGVTYVGGRTLSFGNVVVSGADAATTFIAPMATASDDADEDLVVARKLDALGRALTAAGLRWERLTAEAMRTMQWKKLVVNAGINPIASILNTQNKGVGACEWSRACVRTVVREAFEVATKEGVTFQCSDEELVHEVLQVAANTGLNVCSMLADLRRGSRTEIEEITGRIVALGRTHNVPTPANALLLQLVKALETRQTHLSS